MRDILEETKDQLRRDLGSPECEWQILSELLKRAGSQVNSVLKWVFAEHKGYIETRARAGLEYLKDNPLEGWSILRCLINNNDPDDRDTALTVLAMSGDPRAPQLAQPLLGDTWPYLQFDAADFLKEIYPLEVAITLQDLLTHEEEWVRDEAQKRLVEMSGGAGDGPV